MRNDVLEFNAGVDRAMRIEDLRQKHPKFTYESYSMNQREGALDVKYDFTLEPNIRFSPEVTLPLEKEVDPEQLDNLAFHLGMIESISYWKSACPPELSVEAGKLSTEQIGWWHNLFIHGLGEFYYKNDIDFSKNEFLNITNSYHGEGELRAHESSQANGDLILVGGGKDSGVTLEVLREEPGRKRTLILNPTRSAIDNVKITGYEDPLIVSRRIDPQLLQLNAEGYLNGHTPFSAYLAFLGTFVGVLHDFENVIVSNERSASEGNAIFHGMEVNHQYSKSFDFERLFREYSEKHLSKSVNYFSFLRPLFDIQISRLFAQKTELHDSYRSCNVNQREDSWCGKCPKCAFVYMSLFPYISGEQVEKIFGHDYFYTPEIQEHVRDLVGVGDHKPFECVGTEEESKLAVALSIRKYREMGKSLPPALAALEVELGVSDQQVVAMLEDRVNGKWDDNNFLPREYTQLLKNAIDSITS